MKNRKDWISDKELDSTIKLTDTYTKIIQFIVVTSVEIMKSRISNNHWKEELKYQQILK